MDLLKIIIATLVATSLMTLFSYILSRKLNKQYREPQLLAEIIAQYNLFDSKMQHVGGWVLHYCVGLAFVVAYHFIWENTFLDPTWFCGILFGIVSGIIGIFGWRMIFGIARHIPRIDFRGYFLNLLLAHIVFALGAVAVYALMQ